jgi:hypothetical protein
LRPTAVFPTPSRRPLRGERRALSASRKVTMPFENVRHFAVRPLLALGLVLLATAAAAQPRIEFDPPSLDFGVLQQHESRDATVMIRNVGTETLEIREIESTCGCTVPELAVTTVAPGDAVPMEIHFNSKTFQGMQRKFVKIFSNDPRQSVAQFLVAADIKVPLMMTPGKAMVRFPTLHVGETNTQTYTFSTGEVASLEMDVRSKPGWLDVAFRQGRSAQELYVDFTITGEAPPGRHREPIKLTSNVPAVPVVNMQADVKLVSDLVLGQETVNLRMVRPGQELETRVRVAAYRPDTKFQLTRAEVDVPGLKASVENGARESFVLLDGEAIAGDHPLAQENGGRIQGTLRIYTDLASTPQLEVPVRYLLRR